ncbi:hypothetical protein CGQ24_13845 [Arthrobacter sp. 7749]|nr:hypothetical protein CGQ24_13845 [Arthrobacter sp. 7749]
MSDWTVVNLAHETDWDPGRLTISTFQWPSDAPIIALRDLTLTLDTDAKVRFDRPVLTPDSVDQVTGFINRYSRRYGGAVYQIHGAGEDGVRPGDLLIPPSDRPVIYVNEALVGALASARFLAVRPQNIDGHWLWAALNSSSGRALRRRVTSDGLGTVTALAALRSMMVPVPSLNFQSKLRPRIEAAESALREQAGEAPSTWWTTKDLTQVDWSIAIAAADTSSLDDGQQLAYYCAITPGQSFGRASTATTRGYGFLPVATGSYLTGLRPLRFLPEAEARIIAHPGDILIASIGDRANAQILEQHMAASTSVFILRPFELNITEPLVRFLNSRQGNARRQMLTSGGIMPRLRTASLASLPVPDGAFTDHGYGGAAGPLELYLEGILWQN